MDASFNEMDVNMFNQYLYKSDNDSLNVALSQGQQQHQQFISPQQQQQQQQPTVISQYQGMSDQTFHTPSFGDEEFDIPVDLQSSYQMHNDIGSLMSNQQTTAYGQHWQSPSTTGATTAHSIMSNQTFQSNYPLSSITSNQQMVMMQHQPVHHHATASTAATIQQTTEIVTTPHQQMNNTGNNYIGPTSSSPHAVPINSIENGSTTTDDSDDNTSNDPNTSFKRPSPEPFESELTKSTAIKKGGGKALSVATSKAAKKKKKDPNEPQKPVTAYVLFFRDTQAAIKGQNPNASFGEISKIVASMWDVLAPEHKNVYKKKQEAAMKDYRQALSEYRGNLQTSEDNQEQTSTLTAPVINPPQQTYTQQNFQFVSQQQPQPPTSMMQQSQNATMMTIQHTQQQQQAMPGQQQTIITQQQQQFTNQQELPQQNFQQQQQQQQQQIINSNPLPPIVNQQANSAQICIRSGCTNPAVVSIDWEDEYCSNECCLSHCKNVFASWIQNNQQNFTVAS